MLKLLLVDDQEHVLSALELLFEMHEIPTARAVDHEEALRAVRAGDIGVVLQDMNFTRATTSGEEGVALFHDIRQLAPRMPVILMTAWGSFATAVSLVKQGADDYFQKPWNEAQLVRKVQNLLRARALPQRPTPGTTEESELCGLIHRSAEMEAVVRLAIKVATSDVPVLVTGPNGSGKEKLAEIVHANSARRDAPFIKVNVGALPDELFSAELFGAEAGAFTGSRSRRIGRFEVADGGTLLLDEIGNLSMANQAKLLRALQSGEFERLGSSDTRRADVRVIAATNADMNQAIATGVFREDLFYRLAVIELQVPGLAQRLEDVELLAKSFVARHANAQSRSSPEFSQACIAAMEAHPWNGNVRELDNRVQRALLTCTEAVIRSDDMGLGAEMRLERSEPEGATVNPFDRAERLTVERALRDANYVVSAAARQLGVSRQALYRRMQRLGVQLKRNLED